MQANSEAVARAIELSGGPAKVGRLLGVSTQAACFWRDGKRALPERHAPALERASGHAVRRWQLRPADWHLIWPELVGDKDAPSAPCAAATTSEAPCAQV